MQPLTARGAAEHDDMCLEGHTCCMNWPIQELGSEPFCAADKAGLPRRSPEAISVGHAAMACCGRHTHCVSHTASMPRQTLLSHRHEPVRP